MVMARGHYVYGQNLAFPYAEGLLSGPFEEPDEAWAEMRRLRPLYPEANLSVRPHRAKRLPVKTPRRGAAGRAYGLSTVGGRREAAEAIAAHVRGLGLACEIEDWDGEPDVSCRSATLLGHVWLGDTPAAPMPIISWVADDPRHLRANLPGAWRGTHPHRKATSEPASWGELFDALEIGLLASIDGSAFE